MLDGIPGLERPAGARPAVRAHRRIETQQTDIILTLTPHIIRVLDLSEADLRAFRVGRDRWRRSRELPLPVEPPRRRTPRRQPRPPPLAATQPGAHRQPRRCCRRSRRRRRRARRRDRSRSSPASAVRRSLDAPSCVTHLRHVRAERPAAARPAARSRARRSRAAPAGSRRRPPAPPRSAPCPIADRGCRAGGRAACAVR